MSLSFEIVVSKLLSQRGADGKYIGFHFLLSEGILGTLCLAITSILGDGVFAISSQNFWLMMLGGLSGVIAVNLLQYSVAIGTAGIASSIFNTNVAFFTALCFFFLGQALSSWQIGGIAITTVGAVFLSINDDVLKWFRCCRLQPSGHEGVDNKLDLLGLGTGGEHKRGVNGHRLTSTAVSLETIDS